MCCILSQGHSDHEHSRTVMAPLLAESIKLPPTIGALKQHILEYTGKPEYGARPALLSRCFWIHCRMAITKMLMDSLHQLQLIYFQHPRLSLRWYDVNAKETVHHGGVPANTTTCNVQISAWLTHHVRMMKSPTLKIVYLMMIVMTNTHSPS